MMCGLQTVYKQFLTQVLLSSWFFDLTDTDAGLNLHFTEQQLCKERQKMLSFCNKEQKMMMSNHRCFCNYTITRPAQEALVNELPTPFSNP